MRCLFFLRHLGLLPGVPLLGGGVAPVDVGSIELPPLGIELPEPPLLGNDCPDFVVLFPPAPPLEVEFVPEEVEFEPEPGTYARTAFTVQYASSNLLGFWFTSRNMSDQNNQGCLESRRLTSCAVATAAPTESITRPITLMDS